MCLLFPQNIRVKVFFGPSCYVGILLCSFDELIVFTRYLSLRDDKTLECSFQRLESHRTRMPKKTVDSSIHMKAAHIRRGFGSHALSHRTM
jgi:hypothetical protein